MLKKYLELNDWLKSTEPKWNESCEQSNQKHTIQIEINELIYELLNSWEMEQNLLFLVYSNQFNNVKPGN